MPSPREIFLPNYTDGYKVDQEWNHEAAIYDENGIHHVDVAKDETPRWIKDAPIRAEELQPEMEGR